MDHSTAMAELLHNPATLRFVLHERFDAFIGRVFMHLKPGETYSSNWLTRCMAWHLEQTRKADERRLIINVPPRHLKSICASVAFPAFLLAHNPRETIILVCYSTQLGEKMMSDLRSVMQSSWYKRMYPETRLRKDTAHEITTTQGGGVNMTSVNGTLTGRGAGYIIVDDPIKAGDVQSDAERRRTNEWFQNTLFSRLDDKRTGRIIVAMQRLHEDDVTGHLTDDPNHGWRVLKVPALMDEPTDYRVLPKLQLNPNAEGSPTRLDFIEHRPAGSVIDPNREDVATIERAKSELGNLNFSAQYQQEPVAREGNLVRSQWFRTYDLDSLPETWDAKVASWDTASAAGANNDFSVGTVWGVKDVRYYLLKLYRFKLEYPGLKQKIDDVHQTQRLNLTLLEAADSGRNLYHDLRHSRRNAFRAISPEYSKEDRLAACSAIIEEGRVYLPEEAHWKLDLLNELRAFPNAKHDDQVDSLSMFLNYMRQRNGGKLVYDGAGRKVQVRKRGSRPIKR